MNINIYSFLKQKRIKSTLNDKEVNILNKVDFKMAYAATDDTLNYLGQMYSVGARSTPFLNLLGNPVTGNGLSNKYRTVSSFEFDCAQYFDSGAGSQPAVDETTARGSLTATTKTRGQDNNTCQIFQRLAEVTYKKLSTTGTVYTGLAGDTVDGVTAGLNFNVPGNPVQNELDWQVEMNLKGMASDLNYTCLNGSYQLAAAQGTAAKTRGLANAITTNTVAAGSVALSQTHVDQVMKAMIDSGAPRNNLILFCNSFQKQRLGKLYEFAPMDRFVGGSQINRIYTDFGILDIVYDPNMPAASIFIVEMSVVRIVICPVKGQYMIIEDKQAESASYKKHMYLQAGLDYGPEEYHGSITGLTTS